MTQERIDSSLDYSMGCGYEVSLGCVLGVEPPALVDGLDLSDCV